MRKVFLGRPLHWVLLALIAAIFWGLGTIRLHVTDFNVFMVALFLVAACLVVALRATTAPDERLTREPLSDGEDGPQKR